MTEITTTSAPTTVTTGTVWAVMGVIVLVAIILYVIPAIIVQWKMFKKAGFKGWEAIIPFYSTYVFGIISKQPMWAVWGAIITSVAGATPVIGSYIGIFGLIFSIILLVGFIKQYSASGGFWVSYILFPFIAVFLVDKVTYIGASTPGQSSTPSGQPAGVPTPTQPTSDPAAVPAAPTPPVVPTPPAPPTDK